MASTESTDGGGPHTPAQARLQVHARLEIILICGGLGVLLFALPHRIISDGVPRFFALSQLLTSGYVSDVKYSMVAPLFSAPLWWLGKVWQSPEWWCARYNFLVFALGLLVAYRLLRHTMRGDVLRRFLLILIFGSMFPRWQMGYFGDVFTAVLVGVGFLAVTCGYSVLGWCSVVLGVVNMPASAVGLICAVLAWCWRTRRWRYLVILPVAAGLVLAENWIRRGGPFITGYAGDRGPITVLPYSGRPGFSYPFLLGVISILFSFGKGLFLFAPGLLLPVRRRLSAMKGDLRSTYTLWIWFLVGLVLVNAKWYGWFSGNVWGPRVFLFASIPASLALAVWSSRPGRGAFWNLIVLVVLGWSFWVGVNGAVFDVHGLDICWENDYALESLSWYVPEFSVLFRPFIVPKPLGMPDVVVLGYGAVAFVLLAVPALEGLLRGLVGAGKRAYANARGWRF